MVHPQVSQVLNNECEFDPVEDFGQFIDAVVNQNMDAPTATAGRWSTRTPARCASRPRHRRQRQTGRGRDRGRQRSDIRSRRGTHFERAVRRIARDMPAVPLWSLATGYVWSAQLDNVRLNVLTGEFDLARVTVRQ